MRATVRALVVALASSFVVPAASARACSCAVPAASVARDASAFVFEGVLIRHRAQDEGAVATFRVERVWRGELGRTVTVRTPGLFTLRPPHFEQGERYIVYAGGSPGNASVQACARYAFGDGLAAERRALGAPIRVRARP